MSLFSFFQVILVASSYKLTITSFLFLTVTALAIAAYYVYRYRRAKKSYYQFTKYIKVKYYDRNSEPSYAAKTNYADVKKRLIRLKHSFPYKFFVNHDLDK